MDKNINADLNNGEILSKISDVMRIVDPIQKRTIEYKNKDIPINEIHCFEFLSKNEICDNCISMRAYNDNTEYVKIEYNKEKAYLISAVPYILDNRKVVVEIIKDITHSFLFDSFGGKDNELTGIHALIDGMNKLAFSDPLTGLYNRRYIIERLPVDVLDATLLSKELSIIMVDIDYFKYINDNYGHLAGDQVLKNVSVILSGCIKREGGWVARYGGDEFLICLPGADLDAAKLIAESMRNLIEKSAIEHDGGKFNITSSFGVHDLKSSGSENIDEFLKHADNKLYLAKNNGRNRIEY
ncbi:MAG: GGDEF domain-containing protein [Eubacteriales bacterium]|nr:GGDEF domain-containing protein [Eubacteriales bacterium]